ncbi:SDR family NAD(P)-dependent oxidoreductase [Peribacillus psychrosaccharolyticus]|uniref:SDR family NAD(P)-dependent oxidoreductase n=1 Tax=Peribacillus psychrosaccharolyticus TaxID=1407 RepID=A0A974NQ68_PERPY|nr:SDR family NAD(P)-dependent oxidoreductase [Peribacillus psychrosaccharolyticus]MEC2055076.1 SDR family NAD(P)-dependent oxidoreductase [Peribacillus psychrosaccharolyticus]MED3743872.1 SDR family NAD(P)-dependent oxidoreductase [Peribacillus psychrosaccharolyticus]QQT02014.1 SDR family NAD(P)-dependent oxidoreductase [Peribacillus psychrosaccharolyticus]
MNKNQRENIAMITGASAGIGLELTRKLLSEDWQVIALNRSDFPTDDMRIQEAFKSGWLRIYKTTDLADYASLRRALEEIKDKEQRIDILFNNAGGTFPELSYSKQGREKHYELLTVVPYIILMELKKLIKKGRLKTVINTSSSALKFTKEFNIEILERPKIFRKLLGPYATSKLALSLWTQAIASQLAEDDIKIRSVDPGSNNTLRKGKKSGLPILVQTLMKLFFSAPTHGAGKLYEGALGEHRNETGVFLLKGQVADLKFKDQARNVLERINMIYEHEFLQRNF